MKIVKKVVRYVLHLDQNKMYNRKSLSDHPFGTMKRALCQYYFLLKGKLKLTDEINNRNPFTALKKAKEDLKTADEELRQAELRVTKAQNKIGKGSKEEEAAIKKLRQAKDKHIKKNRQYQAAEKSVTRSINELCDNLDQVGSTIGGPVGEGVSLIGQIGSVTMDSIQ